MVRREAIEEKRKSHIRYWSYLLSALGSRLYYLLLRRAGEGDNILSTNRRGDGPSPLGS